METIQRIKNYVAACDIYHVGDLLTCSDCAPEGSTPEVWQYFYVNSGAWCDYCGRDLVSPRMFDTTPHAL